MAHDVRRSDIAARFMYVSQMLKAIEPLIDMYIEEGGDRHRLVGFVEAKFDARDLEITAKIEKLRD